MNTLSPPASRWLPMRIPSGWNGKLFLCDDLPKKAAEISLFSESAYGRNGS
jgi:hypothetical protein